MSEDSSRQSAEHVEQQRAKNSDLATLDMPSGAGLNIAYQATLPDDARPHSTTSKLPTSGRASVARLPVIDQETYHIEGEVAQGGIGRVLSARDKRLDRRVAVKVLLEESGAYEDRFVREALVTARLQHPSIVPVYEAGRWPSGEPFYSMKLVSGQPLLEIIEKSRTLDERLPLLTRVLAVADAMAYAHEKRIIHRDLKPANILIGAHGETMLIDWGLAKDLNEAVSGAVEQELALDPHAVVPDNGLTMMGSVMGTPAYMPPEQAGGEAVDERADVYALGAILYHVLSGKQPYDGLNGFQILTRVLEEAPTPLPTLQSGISLDLLALVSKAMSRDPAARYPTAKEFADDLRRFLAGQLVGAHQYSRRERALRFIRKNRAALAVAASAFVVMAVNGAFNMSRIVRERDRAEAARQSAEVAREKALVAEHHAIERADELTLVEARAAVERDPNAALAWLKVLSPSFRKWSAARVIAADAWSRGASTGFRGHKLVINRIAFSPDERQLITASDDHTARIFDVATGDSRVLAGHTDEVWSTAISPDGKLAVTASKDTTIRLWDIASGTTIKTLRGHTAGIVYTIFSRDGKQLFTQSDDCTLRVWDLATGSSRILITGPDKSLKSAVSPNERQFVTAGDTGSVWLVGIDAPAKRLPALTVNWDAVKVGGIFPLIFSPDGQKIVAGGIDGLVRVWDIAAEKLRILEGQTNPIVRVTFSPDGKQLAAASVDGSLRLWDLDARTSRVLPSQESNVRTLVFSPDGQKLAAGGYDRVMRVIDLSTGKRRRFVGMQDSVIQSLFTKDGTRLVAAGADGSLRVFRLEHEPGRTLGRHAGAVITVDVSNRGDRIVSAGKDGVVNVWPVHGDEPVASLVGHVGTAYAARFSPNGELVVSAGIDGTVRLWDVSGHQIRATQVEKSFSQTHVEFSPNGAAVAIGDATGLVRLWDVDSGGFRELGRHDGIIKHVAFSPDGKMLGSASSDKTARVWNLETGQSQTLSGHEASVDSIGFSPDSRTIVTGSFDHRLRIWDPGATEPRAYDASGFTVWGLSFLPDGKSLLSFGGESLAHWWDVPTGKTRGLFRGHRGMIISLALSPDGTAFVTGADDRTARLYDIETGESRVLGVHEGVVLAVEMAPDGKWAVSVGEDGAVRVWPDDLPREPEALRAWISQSVSDEIDVEHMGEGSVPLP